MKTISGLEWGSNRHTHISDVLPYQLSHNILLYQVPGSRVHGGDPEEGYEC
jgi:hypothetical protein